MRSGADVRAAKDGVRRRVLAARRALAPAQHAARAEALAEAAVALAAEVAGAGPVCAYLPFGTEPGTPDMAERLLAAGHEVLLPLVRDDAGPLEWARFAGMSATVTGAFGIREPTGDLLGQAAIGRAGLVLVPALAADRTGTRLGRGRGHYDRTLPLAAPTARIVVVVDDDELVEELPAEPHDRRIGTALTPRAGIVWLGNTS